MKRKPKRIPASREVFVHTILTVQRGHPCDTLVPRSVFCPCEDAVVLACEVCGSPMMMFVKDLDAPCECAVQMIAAGLRP